MLCLPYQGKQWETTVPSLARTLHKIIGDKVETKVVFNSTKLFNSFYVKDKTLKEHENNVVYKLQCPQENCYKTYIGETRRRVIERVKIITEEITTRLVYRHSIENGHPKM